MKSIETLKQYIEDNTELLNKTLKELCLIPAPSYNEEKRAAYCKKRLESFGAKDVYIDEAKNVIFPINCQNSNNITVVAAHTDTVFPDTEPMPYSDDGEKVYCPGAADDTASVVVLLLTAKYFIENNIRPENGVMFVFNSCEEGLGNLYGTKKLFEAFANRIETFITLDSALNYAVDKAVGSHRYEVTVQTEGGHSFAHFGNNNAIARISETITDIYKIKIPEKQGAKTTYNVGTIKGGTSVNTIAQSAGMLCEYRSDDKECLEIMKREFERIFENAAKKAKLTVALVGDRPCSNTEQEKIERLKQTVTPIIEDVLGEKLNYVSGSTDCNIPLSLGVAALCIGVCNHANVHTREEWVDKKSIRTGLMISLRTCLELLV